MLNENQTTEIKNEQNENRPEEVSPAPHKEEKPETNEDAEKAPKAQKTKTKRASKKADEVETPKPEEKEEPAQEPNKDEELIETLRAEIEELKQAKTQSENLSTELETVKATLTEKETLVTEYEAILTTITDAKLEAIPQKFRALVPQSLTLTKKLEWLNTAEETGLFKANEAKTPEIEIGKPMNAQPPKVDTSKLSGSELMRMAYNTITKK